jgi:ParB/RepB/Spo0J family partition protein
MTLKTNQFVQDGIFEIPRKNIHPDPDQPRVKVDADLQASIDAEGIIQAITVRPHPELADEWMIVDGERRYLGGAHLKTIPCRIRLDLEDPVDRLITQLAANQGKPLSPIEEAKAFKKALDADPKLSQAKLADRLGIPRSTVGDRIRLIEIHPAWMKLIESGKLQVSHAPLIHQYRAVPAEYQEKAAAYVRDVRPDDVIRVADMRKELYRAFRDYVIRMDRVRGYKGPVIEVEEESWEYAGGRKLRKVKYAADIKLWRPIRNAAEKRQRKENRSMYAGSSSYGYESALTKAKKQIVAAGHNLQTRKKAKGDTVVHGESGWASGIDPKTLLEKLDPSTLVMVTDEYGGAELATTDRAAVTAAQTVFRARVAEIAAKELAPLRAKLGDEVLAKYSVQGPGVEGLMQYVRPGRGEPKVVALALGLEIAGEIDDDSSYYEDDSVVPVLAAGSPRSDAERLLAGLAAVAALKIKVPDNWSLENKIRQAIGNPAFKVEKATATKSKKQQKREARARGEQVGDPTRAHDDNLHGLLDEEHVEEEELVEA